MNAKRYSEWSRNGREELFLDQRGAAVSTEMVATLAVGVLILAALLKMILPGGGVLDLLQVNLGKLIRGESITGSMDFDGGALASNTVDCGAWSDAGAGADQLAFRAAGYDESNNPDLTDTKANSNAEQEACTGQYYPNKNHVSWEEALKKFEELERANKVYYDYPAFLRATDFILGWVPRWNDEAPAGRARNGRVFVNPDSKYNPERFLGERVYETGTKIHEATHILVLPKDRGEQVPVMAQHDYIQNWLNKHRSKLTLDDIQKIEKYLKGLREAYGLDLPCTSPAR